MQRQVDSQTMEVALWKDKFAKMKEKYHASVVQAEELTATLQRLMEAHGKTNQDAQEAHKRIEALEYAKSTLVQELGQVREQAQTLECQAIEARREANQAQAIADKLQESAKRRRGMVAQHRRIQV